MNVDNFHSTVEEKVLKKIKNPDFNLSSRGENEVLFSNKQMMFEQYKLLIDSAHKIEERRGESNNIFLGINTLLASFLIRPSQLIKLTMMDAFLLIALILIGIFISWDWLKIIASYRRLNFANYSLIEACEKFLPMKIFSLRAEMEIEQSEQKPSNRANIILIKENILPKVFIAFYVVYLGIIISLFLL